MKKLKFILVVVFGLSFSLEAFSEVGTSEIVKKEIYKGPDMNQFETDEEGFQAEVTFEEEEGIDITSEDLESTFTDALASR